MIFRLFGRRPKRRSPRGRSRQLVTSGDITAVCQQREHWWQIVVWNFTFPSFGNIMIILWENYFLLFLLSHDFNLAFASDVCSLVNKKIHHPEWKIKIHTTIYSYIPPLRKSIICVREKKRGFGKSRDGIIRPDLAVCESTEKLIYHVSVSSLFLLWGFWGDQEKKRKTLWRKLQNVHSWHLSSCNLGYTK